MPIPILIPFPLGTGMGMGNREGEVSAPLVEPATLNRFSSFKGAF
jgi:hypothetical protein